MDGWLHARLGAGAGTSLPSSLFLHCRKQVQEVQGRPACLQLQARLRSVSLVRQHVECREQSQQGLGWVAKFPLLWGIVGGFPAGSQFVREPEFLEGSSIPGLAFRLRRFLLRGDISRNPLGNLRNGF